MSTTRLWERYQALHLAVPAAGITLDVSRIDFPDEFLTEMEKRSGPWFAAMKDLEAGAIANPDEERMVGHYWLRAPDLAPGDGIRNEITGTVARIRKFAADVHAGTIAPPVAPAFKNILVIGIGGSALGPQFVADALGGASDRMRVFFSDNTDPDGMDRTFEQIAGAEGGFAATLAIVISKSGGTKETRNAMLETAAAYARQDLEFPRHAVAVTGAGSELDRVAGSQEWLAVFPMWDWVGGRTSELSAVGLLPAALQGIDIDGLLEGARVMDAATRTPSITGNAAALLAAAWHCEGQGKGLRDMVVLPYKDRLLLLSRYLQQLVMESLGKEKNLKGEVVHQGLAVYGNKGSTDQHAYVQQLRDGIHNFFVTFIGVMKDRDGDAIAVDPGVTSGDYLLGFRLGTRAALHDSGRGSVTITVPDVSPASVGALIALFERAVGLYALMIGINAYHQPGVEAGKKAATRVLQIQEKVVAELKGKPARTAGDVAAAAGLSDDVETVWHILEHLAANSGRGVRKKEGTGPFDALYSA